MTILRLISKRTQLVQEIEIELKGITAQLAEINESIDAIPAEIIDIDSVNKSIKEKRESTRSLTSKNRLLESKIDVNKQTFEKVAAFIESFDLNVLTEQKEEHNRLLSLKSSNSSDIREGETEKEDYRRKSRCLTIMRIPIANTALATSLFKMPRKLRLD